METIPMLQEFQDVFPIDLSGVPPNRDIDFTIDLDPGTKPIYITLYLIFLCICRDHLLSQTVVSSDLSLCKALTMISEGKVVGLWDQNMPLAEFAYNSYYHSNIQMDLFEALYSGRCRSPNVYFDEVETESLDKDLLTDAKKQLCILFSMSAMIEKHVRDESHVISLDLVVLGAYLSFEKEHIAILDRQSSRPTRAKYKYNESRLEDKSQGKRARAKAAPSFQDTAPFHDHHHGRWCGPRLVLWSVVAKAVATLRQPLDGLSSRATSRPVVRTTTHGKAREDAFNLSRPRHGGLATGPMTTSRTTASDAKGKYEASRGLVRLVTSRRTLFQCKKYYCEVPSYAILYGVVIFTGQDTKVMQNSTDPPSKKSGIEKKMDKIYVLFGTLITITFIGSIFFGIETKNDISGGKLRRWFLQPDKTSVFYDPKKTSLAAFFHFLTALMLYGYLIPISLYVFIEIVKVLQSIFINQDREMYYEETDKPAHARTSNLNEELGLVDTILSVKTDTLTCNSMEFDKCSIACVAYGRESSDPTVNSKKSIKGFNFKDEHIMNGQWVHESHRDILQKKLEFGDLSYCYPDVNKKIGEISYEVESPDEAAFVIAARQLGFQFFQRTQSRITLHELNHQSGKMVDSSFGCEESLAELLFVG
ncbi:hypothetical protein MTR67_048763 [Solanum verrucosum]|uniref:P-type phospholipid transporter n=1 Tax=Solanum verrucosum TaxID=315347 RepID=A0AAF0V258_SOLVR|nr:hypothetical protein MTR67_048763 [Solanum verrucosum]